MKFRKYNLLVLLFLVFIFAAFNGAGADGILEIPSGVNTIEEEAFMETNASTVIIPTSVEMISSRAFASCASLTDVYLPAHRVNIAEDAFDDRRINFYVYFGSDNEVWAKQHGYDVAYVSEDATLSDDPWGQVNNLVANEAISTTQDNPYYTHRLIMKTKSGYDLPALDHYNPKEVVPIGGNRFVIQFENDTDASTCANALNEWPGKQYVNVDYFLSSTDSAKSSTLTSKGINANDPMGFGDYVDYLGSNVGNVTVAVIDSGVNADQVPCNVSSKSYDFINNRSNAVSGFTSHGTLVAQTMCDAFGSLANHLTIISYRIENPANSRISYIQMGEAILRAQADGAELINISIAGESPYSSFQDNEFLKECIDNFGSSWVIAAGGNSATSVDNYIPAKYCTSVTGVKLENGEFSRASGTALNADYGGFASTTSVAAPKITAAMALVKLDPDSTHTFGSALVNDNASQNGMPNLAKLPIRLVERINFAEYSNNDTIILEVGDPLSIQYSAYPSNATVSTVTPVSSDNSIVKYKSHTTTHARFTAVAPGTADLVFTSDDGNAEARLTVQVVQLPVSVTISGQGDGSVYKDESVALSATVLPADTTNKKIIWSTSNSSIADISSISDDTLSCVIAWAKSGNVVITATAQANREVYDEISLSMLNISRPDHIVISPMGGASTIYKGKTIGSVQMLSQVYPTDADQTVEWSSSNPSVATIDINTGMVTAVGRGETIISANSVVGSAYGFYDHITVIQLPTSVTISGTTSIIEGNTTTLSVNVEPSNTNDPSVTWNSNNTKVATVSNNGVVTGIKSGTALISATSNADRTVAGSCYVIVNPATFTVTFNANGGSCSTSTIIATKGVKLGTLPTPTRDYFRFLGWYTAASDGTQVTSETVYNSASPVTVYAHWEANPLSNWVEPSAVPSGAVTVESKTQYRYRDYSAWSAWGAWQTSRETISDSTLKQEQTATIYPWYYYKCPNCGYHNKLTQTNCTKSSCKKYFTGGWNGPIWTTNKWTVTSQANNSTGDNAKVSYTETEYGYGLLWSFSNHQSTGVTNSANGYRYRTRTVGSWTGWSDSVVTSSETRDVQTRIMVRYREK